MTTARIILKEVLVDDCGKTLSEKIVSDKNVITPTDISNFGYNHSEQLNIMGNFQQSFLDAQAKFLDEPPKQCPRCSAKVWKHDQRESDFQHVFSSHKVKLQGWRCSSNDCTWSYRPSIKKLLSGKTHIDLVKLKTEYGSNQSYREAAKGLKRIVGENRKDINAMSIQRTTKESGNLLSTSTRMISAEKDKSEETQIAVAKELCVVVDGGHVHDANHKGHNFEVMTSKTYRPENVIRIDKNHTEIISKDCAASAKYDKQETMKCHLIEATKKQGVDKNVTVITGLADGAKNCWNILESLSPFCLSIIYILDWFHIGKYIQNMRKSIPILEEVFENIREFLWHGNDEAALSLLSEVLFSTTDVKQQRLLKNFFDYINDNQTRIVNYDERQRASLIFSSHVAESTVEHLLNRRAKKKQKMQWSRDGLHTVMQIRCSQASARWNSDWDKISDLMLIKAA